MILFSFAANITNISEQPATSTFKPPYGKKQHVFFSKTLTACKRHDISTQKFWIPIISNMKFQISTHELPITFDASAVMLGTFNY
jgi:hypothetical protein